MWSVRSRVRKARFFSRAANLSSGHCRRRKIRCVIAPEDPNARCHNCIRLKKDCHFYPVEQQPQLVKRTRSGSQFEATPNDQETSVSSSSPAPNGISIEQMGDFSDGQIENLSISQGGQHYSRGLA